MSKRTWFRHQENKRRRLTGESVSGGGSAGPTGSNTDTDGDEPLAGLATGSAGGGGGETTAADCPPGPDHTAHGGGAACSEDSLLSSDQDVDQDGEDGESRAVSTDAESVDCSDVPPAASVVEEPADEAGPAAELIGLPESVVQHSVSSNEVQRPVTQLSENAED